MLQNHRASSLGQLFDKQVKGIVKMVEFFLLLTLLGRLFLALALASLVFLMAISAVEAVGYFPRSFGSEGAHQEH